MSTQEQYDAIIIGAGFSGVRMLKELRDRGLSVRVLEAGDSVGGTWFWNRYPGARTDSECWAYGYLFDDDLFNEWEWSERYPSQPEVQRYLCHVVERFDLLREIQFDARVRSAVYDEPSNRWKVATVRGEELTCTYLIPATGLLSVAWDPPFDGVDSFAGESYVTGRWPDQPVDVAGKRVGVVGTGATAVQVIPVVAQAAAEVVVFQRTPTYVLPARNRSLDSYEQSALRNDLARIRKNTRRHLWAVGDDPVQHRVRDTTPEDRHRALEWAWEHGGLQFLFGTYPDMVVHPKYNEEMCEFVREKIRSIVRDPETAEHLVPTHAMGAKRPPLGHRYYQAFNRNNVRLIDVAAAPIERVVPAGLQTADGVHELDMIIYATGFDATTGALRHIDVRGRDDRAITDLWQDGPRTLLGVGVDGFPNLFVINGPHTPLANYPPVIEEVVGWIGRAIDHMRAEGLDRIEPTEAAVDAWAEHIESMFPPAWRDSTVSAWFLGTSRPGKPPTAMHYFRGADQYFEELRTAAERGYEGFQLSRATERVPTA